MRAQNASTIAFSNGAPTEPMDGARPASRTVWLNTQEPNWANAVAESFFATLKKELIHRHSWPTRRELSSAVFEYIEAFYNRERRHSTLGMHSPTDYEKLVYAANVKESPTTKNIKSNSVV